MVNARGSKLRGHWHDFVSCRDLVPVVVIFRFSAMGPPSMMFVCPKSAHRTTRWLRGLTIASVWLGGTCVAHAMDFVHDIVPILQRNCVVCHGGREAEGDFSLNTRKMLEDSGFVVAGDADSSYLLELLTSDDPDVQMPPPERPRVTATEISLIRSWINKDMPWDESFTFAIESYEPPLRLSTPTLPPIRDGRDQPIDRILDNYLASQNLPTPGPIDDATYLRRVSLDLVGLLPSREKLETFVNDPSPQKRLSVVDELLSDPVDYADHWMTFFNDLLRNDYSGTGFITKGRTQVSGWLYRSLLENKPFDVMTRELIAPASAESQGFIDGIKWRGKVSAGQSLPIQFSQSISQAFLGINMKCASCHDSFVDRWTLRDAYGLAAIYSDEPLELHRCDKPTGQMAEAAWVFPELGRIDPASPRAERLTQLANLMTHQENGRFARTIVNRLWNQMMGRGIVHPLDAMQNRPWSEDLLNQLAVDFVRNDYDLKATLRSIAASQAYQSQSEVARLDAAGDSYTYRGPRARRMTAEQFLDGIWQLTGDGPKAFDAPVIRGSLDSVQRAFREPAGQWIWGPLENGTVPGGQVVRLRKTFTLDRQPGAGGAMVTADNEFELYINGNRVGRSEDWTKPQWIDLIPHLQQGENVIDAIAINGLTRPNDAGFYFDARLRFDDDQTMTIASDDTWRLSSVVPERRGDVFDLAIGSWESVTVVSTLPAWERVINSTAGTLLSSFQNSGQPEQMIRSSLLENTALMKSLGRPMREQIVSMRPSTVTTLEAVDLANEPSLAHSFAVGAERLMTVHRGDTEGLIVDLFLSALARRPTPAEHRAMKELLGETPELQSVQDAFWAVCMLPEFMLIR